MDTGALDEDKAVAFDEPDFSALVVTTPAWVLADELAVAAVLSASPIWRVWRIHKIPTMTITPTTKIRAGIFHPAGACGGIAGVATSFSAEITAWFETCDGTGSSTAPGGMDWATPAITSGCGSSGAGDGLDTGGSFAGGCDAAGDEGRFGDGEIQRGGGDACWAAGG